MGIVRGGCFQSNGMAADGAQTGGAVAPVWGWMEREEPCRTGVMLVEMADRHGFSARSTSRVGPHRAGPGGIRFGDYFDRLSSDWSDPCRLVRQVNQLRG